MCLKSNNFTPKSSLKIQNKIKFYTYTHFVMFCVGETQVQTGKAFTTKESIEGTVVVIRLGSRLDKTEVIHFLLPVQSRTDSNAKANTSRKYRLKEHDTSCSQHNTPVPNKSLPQTHQL